MSRNTDAKVYIGDLGNNASKSELEDSFSYYGRLRNVWVARNPPGFAFVEFEDARDAEDSVRGLDGRTICGRRVRVELSSGRRRSGRGGGPGGSRGGSRDEKCYDCGERGHFARDCKKSSRSGGGSRKRSRSRSRSRDRRSSSRDRSRSPSRDRSRTPEERRKDDRSPKNDD